MKISTFAGATMAGACACLCLTSRAEGTNEQIAVRSFIARPEESGVLATMSERLWENGSLSFSDRFIGPNASMNWAFRIQRDGYGLHEDATRAGLKTFQNAFGYAARETALAHLPLEGWRDGCTDMLGIVVGNIVENSIGNVNEEREDIVTPAPVYEESELSWWRSAMIDKTVRYGWRPWRPRPYIYAEWNMGRMEKGGPPALTVGIRCYSILDEMSRVGLIKLEGRAVVPITMDCRLSAGGSIYPTELGSDRWHSTWSVRLERSVIGDGDSGIMYIGIKYGSEGMRLATGLTFRY